MKNLKSLLLIISVLAIFHVKAQENTEVYYEPELLMVSQPKMEFYSANDADFVQFYFDVKNIGSETYTGDFMILMEPDVEHYYAKKSIKVKSGAIKRIKVELDTELLYYDSVYTALPVYEFENQWYPLTAYEQFRSLYLCLASPTDDVDYVVSTEPEPVTDYYFDVRLQRPPVYGYYYVTPPPGWAYAYGYNPYCVCNNYVIFNGNGCPPHTGIHVESAPLQQNNEVVAPTVTNRRSAPRVTNNHSSNQSVGNTRRGSTNNSGTRSANAGSSSVSRTRGAQTGTSSNVNSSASRSSSQRSVSNQSSSRSNSSSRSYSPQQSQSSSQRSSYNSSNASSSRSSSNRSSSSNSSSRSSNSSSSGNRSGGGRR